MHADPTRATLRRYRVVATLLCCAALVHVAEQPGVGAGITLYSSAPPASPLTVSPGTTSTPLTVAIVNDVSADPPSDFLTGWQTRLTIVPDSGAVGEVQLAAAMQPAPYIFDGVGSFGISVTNTGSQLTAFDFNFPYSGGVQVPDGGGANLLSIVVHASSDAHGSFGLFAVGGVGQSQWTDATEPLQVTRTFANLPSNDTPVQIAELFVGRPGDYNQDGVVGAADYVVWRNHEGTSFELPNRSPPLIGDVGPADYDFWVANFGDTGRGSLNSYAAVVPEPSAAWLVALLLFLVPCTPRSRRAPSESVVRTDAAA